MVVLSGLLSAYMSWIILDLSLLVQEDHCCKELVAASMAFDRTVSAFVLF